MSNSKLVSYTQLSPNCDPRKNDTYNPSGKVTKITIHHTGGVASVEGLGNGFAKESRQASSNYGIGADARVGMYVPEDYRSWCSGSRENDYLAVTIETSNSAKGGNWPVSDEVLEKLIDLCVDICERNGIEKLNYTGDKSGNLTMHKWFQATTCPGPYLESKFPYIAEEVNKRLKPVEPPKNVDTTTTVNVSILRKGSKGIQVMTVQQMLQCSGYALPKYGADGDFGAETEGQVKAYQRAKGLEADGVVGWATWSYLMKGCL